jgi:hypothetical protein
MGNVRVRLTVPTVEAADVAIPLFSLFFLFDS